MTPELGRSPGEGKGYPLQYSGLENSRDCTVHGIAKSWTQLCEFHFHIRYSRSRTKDQIPWSPFLIKHTSEGKLFPHQNISRKLGIVKSAYNPIETCDIGKVLLMKLRKWTFLAKQMPTLVEEIMWPNPRSFGPQTFIDLGWFDLGCFSLLTLWWWESDTYSVKTVLNILKLDLLCTFSLLPLPLG